MKQKLPNCLSSPCISSAHARLRQPHIARPIKANVNKGSSVFLLRYPMQSLCVQKYPISENGMLVTLSPESRSVSPMTPSPSREIRGLRLFRAISKKLGRRSHEDITNSENVDAESRSSSTDSCSSTSAGRCSRKLNGNSSADSGFRSLSLRHISSSSSDAGSDAGKHKHHHSSSTESIRKVFQNLTVNTQRSQSCSSQKEHKRKSKKPAKRILRSPVTYTYVKGLSGLPTQRVPRNPMVFLNNTCSCNGPYMVGLRR